MFAKLLGQEVSIIEDFELCLVFDGSSTSQGVDISISYVPEVVNVSLSFKLDFPCFNNETKYKTLVIRPISTLQVNVTPLCVQGDSR